MVMKARTKTSRKVSHRRTSANEPEISQIGVFVGRKIQSRVRLEVYGTNFGPGGDCCGVSGKDKDSKEIYTEVVGSVEPQQISYCASVAVERDAGDQTSLEGQFEDFSPEIELDEIIKNNGQVTVEQPEQGAGKVIGIPTKGAKFENARSLRGSEHVQIQIKTVRLRVSTGISTAPELLHAPPIAHNSTYAASF